MSSTTVTINSYSDVQTQLSALTTANNLTPGLAPHMVFWQDLSYDDFVNGNVPNLGNTPILVKGDSASSNIIKVLKGGSYNNTGFPDMPAPDPPYNSETPSQTDVTNALASWIDAGCPEFSSDDLTQIEGIGPKTQAALNDNGIHSYEQLAITKVHKLRRILKNAGLGSFDPGTWPAQANLAHNGEMEALESIQDHLQGGKAPAKKKLTQADAGSSSDMNFRIHPAIGIARVGNSTEYYLGPETAAGDLTTIAGGLPIKPGTESTTITSSDIRDASGALKRQAARFKIYQYELPSGDETYPLGPNASQQEIKIGSTVNGQTVMDIIWTVHLANKKSQFYQADPSAPLMGGVTSFEGANFDKLPLRNPNYPTDGAPADDPQRLKALFIDPGPRTISGQNTPAVSFDKATTASYYNEQTHSVAQIGNYPKSFPDDSFTNLSEPQGPITTLGELQTDGDGRLIVTGGYGRSANFNDIALTGPVDNDGWFDDAGDGPVSAVIVLADGTKLPVQGSAWVAATDPSYAPQIKNVVSLWEDIYDAWVRNLRLIPGLYDNGAFNDNYEPGFYNQLSGVFHGAELQQWIANLNSAGTSGHDGAGSITPSTPPSTYYFNILRDPNDPDQFDTYLSPLGIPYMPLALGDNGQSFLGVTPTQYFFLSQWTKSKFNDSSTALAPGELLDQNVLLNCLGGRFSPGIDLTWITRQPGLYIQDWETSGTGPFRINQQKLDYSQITPGQAFLTEGYVPVQSTADGIQPGDVLKLMALPWHTDYNSCATHPPYPGPGKTTNYPADPPPAGGPPSYDDYSFWSWPAQRPVVTFTSTKPKSEKEQWFTVRGPGTNPVTDPSDPPSSGPDYQNVCRYQTIKDMLTNWQNIGVILQATVIDNVADGYDGTDFLEAESQFPDGVPVPAWPNYLPTSDGD